MANHRPHFIAHTIQEISAADELEAVRLIWQEYISQLATLMNAFTDVERAFRFHRQDLVDLLFEIRNIVSRVYPSATELIGSRGLTFYDPGKGGTITGGICIVDIRKNHVRLRFGRGAYLEDPRSLLKGDQLHMRYMDISSFEAAPWSDIEALIQASADQDGQTLIS